MSNLNSKNIKARNKREQAYGRFYNSLLDIFAFASGNSGIFQFLSAKSKFNFFSIENTFKSHLLPHNLTMS